MKQIIKRVTAVPLKVRASHAQFGFKQTHESSVKLIRGNYRNPVTDPCPLTLFK